MNYRETHDELEILVLENPDTTVTIETDDGSFQISASEALSLFWELSPGEYFQIITER